MTEHHEIPGAVPPGAKPGPGAAASKRGREQLRILLAEDDPDSQVLAARILEKAGYAVTVAADGLAAAAKVRSAHYDLVLMDIQMPGMDGCAAAKEIRAWEAAGRHERTAIVALSAGAAADCAQGVADGVLDGHIPKPVNRQGLLDAAAAWIDARRKVLVADDSPDSLILIELCLGRRRDLRLIFAHNGREAVEKFSRYAFALVLTDMEMPEMDGYAAAGLMRGSPGGAGAPIVALTASGGAAAVKKCLDAGCDECVTKPVSMNGLLAVVEKYLSSEGPAVRAETAGGKL